MSKKKKTTTPRVATRALKSIRDRTGRFVSKRADSSSDDPSSEEPWFDEWEDGEDSPVDAETQLPLMGTLPLPDEDEPPPLELRQWERRGTTWYRVDGGRNNKWKGSPPPLNYVGNKDGVRVTNRWEKQGTAWIEIRQEAEVQNYGTVDAAAGKRKKRWGKWWFSDYDYDRKSYEYEVDSGSRSWRDKLGGGWNSGYSWGGAGGSRSSTAFRRLLGQLQKSANLISEDRIKVRWSSGESRNEPGEGVIYLSPDGLMDEAKTGIPDEVVDAMTGKVYISSVLNRTVSEDALDRAKRGRGKSPHINNTVALWEAVETAIARKEVETDWGGFMNYLVSDENRTCASKEEVQKFIDDSVEKPTVEAALAALSWNLLHPVDTVKVPDVYDGAIDAAADAMQDEVLAPERFDMAERMVTRVEEIVGVESQRQEPQKGDGDGDEDEDEDEDDRDPGDGCGCSACDEKQEAWRERKRKRRVKAEAQAAAKAAAESHQPPKITDSSLFGAQVDNDTDENLAKQETSEDDETPGGKVDEEHGESNAGREYSLCDFPRGEKLGEYADLRRSLRREIAVVRSALSFLAVSMGAPSYGHQTGEVDDASLFKLRLDDDRIMQQSDSMSAPTIAVCVLIDESGSMWAQTRSGRARVHVARDVALTLVEGLKEVPGMSVSIYGHSAEMYDGKGEKQYGVLLYRYYTPSMPHAEKLIHAEARSQNLDGFAIQHAANLFAVEHRFSERKIMFVVSDGYPAGHGYGGSLARGHMKRVSDSCQNQLGVEVYGIGIDNAYEERKGSEMYGQGNSVTLKDVSSSLGVMVRFLRQTAITMRRKE